MASPNSARSPNSGLDRRIPDKKTIIKEIAAWERERTIKIKRKRLAIHTADAALNSNASTLHFE